VQTLAGILEILIGWQSHLEGNCLIFGWDIRKLDSLAESPGGELSNFLGGSYRLMAHIQESLAGGQSHLAENW
jgi:hypothetical protein